MPKLGPFLDAFTNMFGDLLVFFGVVLCLAAATAIALSPVFCRSTELANTYQNESTHHLYLNENSIRSTENDDFEPGFYQCWQASFWFLFVKASGGESVEMVEVLYGKDAGHMGEELFYRNLATFNRSMRAFVVLIISAFEVMTAFCLLKGILLHSGIIHKEEAQNHAKFRRNKLYVDNLFNQTNLVGPWNLIYDLISIVTCGKYPKDRHPEDLGIDLDQQMMICANYDNEAFYQYMDEN